MKILIPSIFLFLVKIIPYPKNILGFVRNMKIYYPPCFILSERSIFINQKDVVILFQRMSYFNKSNKDFMLRSYLNFYFFVLQVIQMCHFSILSLNNWNELIGLQLQKLIRKRKHFLIKCTWISLNRFSVMFVKRLYNQLFLLVVHLKWVWVFVDVSIDPWFDLKSYF